MSAEEYGGYVLAGGRSSRMGTDKALLEINGAALVERAARVVQAVVGSAVIVGNPSRYSQFGFPVIADQFPDCGPLGGIHAALRYSVRTSVRQQWNLVVACDMPEIDALGLKQLLDEVKRIPDAGALIPYVAGKPQPLCAMYHVRALAEIEGALRRGCFKILSALAGVDVAGFAAPDHRLFTNVNTPEQWNELAFP